MPLRNYRVHKFTQHPLPELDGSSMFDEGVDCTGQSRSVAAQLRGRHLVDACPCRGGLDGAALGRDGEGVGGDNAGSETRYETDF